VRSPLAVLATAHDGRVSSNTYSLGRFLYDTSTLHSDVPVHFAETLGT
jgi:hypothetical protein